MLCHSQGIINRDIEASPSDLEPEKQFSSMGRESFCFVVAELMSVPGPVAKLIQISPCDSATDPCTGKARVDVTPVTNGLARIHRHLLEPNATQSTSSKGIGQELKSLLRLVDTDIWV